MFLAQKSITNVDRRHDLEFPKWFEDRVSFVCVRKNNTFISC